MSRLGCSVSRVESEIDEAIESWNSCATRPLPLMPRFSRREQRRREQAYDEGLRRVEHEARTAVRRPGQRSRSRQRIVETFPPFAAVALGLDAQAIELLTGTFLPVGTGLAHWARKFDPNLKVSDLVQACRNMWTACGLQALLGRPMRLTPSLVAYSLLYPYSDNFLDQPSLTTAGKLSFSNRFRMRLSGIKLAAHDRHEASVWSMVQLIEDQYSRATYPQVFDALLAIHRAQEQSLAQLRNGHGWNSAAGDQELLRISCAKGGTSVLADAFLAQPWPAQEEIRFAFEWGVLLQLGDDLQDIEEDFRRGSTSLFTRAVETGKPLDGLVMQLLNLSQYVADQMDHLHGSPMLKHLLRMSWRSLILTAVARSQQYFSPMFIAALEPHSMFCFDFLKSRNQNLAAREAFYGVLFDAFLESGAEGDGAEDLPAVPRLSFDEETTTIKSRTVTVSGKNTCRPAMFL